MAVEKVSIYYEARRPSKPWRVRWFGRYDPVTGKRVRYYQSFKQRREAEIFRTTKQAEFNGGETRDRKEIGLEELCQRYLKSKNGALRQSSLDWYNTTISQLLRFFSPKHLAHTITAEMAEDFIATRTLVHLNHVNQGKQLSAWGRNGHLRQAQAIFTAAVEWGYVRTNPFARVQHVKPNSRPWHYVTPEEFNRLLKDTPSLRLRCLYAVMYGGGLRYGEAINLRWAGENIDFKHGRIIVRNRPPTCDVPGFLVKDHENRSVPMTSWLAQMFKDLKAEKAEGQSPFVFLTPERWERAQTKWKALYTDGKGHQWRNRDMANNVLRDFKVHCRTARIFTEDKLTLHCLRKSYAQNLADAGTPIITLKRLMGHCSTKVCEQFYFRATDANEERATQVLERIMEP